MSGLAPDNRKRCCIVWEGAFLAHQLSCFNFVMFLFPLLHIRSERTSSRIKKNVFFNQLISEFLILWSLYMAANPCCHEDFLAMWQIQVSVINTLPDWCCQPDDHRRWQIPSAQGQRQRTFVTLDHCAHPLAESWNTRI